MRIASLLLGFYSTALYLPLSATARNWKRLLIRLRIRAPGAIQQINLPKKAWYRLVSPSLINIYEGTKAHGNVRLSELGILCHLAKRCPVGSTVFEIGTFDGRTTLNLARNVPKGVAIETLDLPSRGDTVYPLVGGENEFTEKLTPGVRFQNIAATDDPSTGRIQQHIGDSATFNFKPFYGKCSLVFVDGSHAYDYVLKDTETALELVAPEGVIVWHDYGIWPDVTRGLEEIHSKKNLGLVNISGTSLVFWRNQKGL